MRSWLWPTIIILSTIAVGLVNFVFTDTPLRPFIAMWFLFVCPGMMLVRFLRLGEPKVEWTLALALSFAIDAIVGGILMYAGRWSITGSLFILMYICLGGTILQIGMFQGIPHDKSGSHDKSGTYSSKRHSPR